MTEIGDQACITFPFNGQFWAEISPGSGAQRLDDAGHQTEEV